MECLGIIIQILICCLIFWFWGVLPVLGYLYRIESKLDRLHTQQMIFVKLMDKLVKALDKILEKEDE